MKPITCGESGPAVEDVQQRLTKLGYRIDDGELAASSFGAATAAAVRSFCADHGLPFAEEVDDQVWVSLVDATYSLGDRTLYLRLPYFHGADVAQLQVTLNVLGFGCGEVDGTYGPHTEAAVREFQANVGLMADGIAFQDTFEAIDRLRHVWDGKTVSAEFSCSHMGLARAADVLETRRILIGATDPIARNVANRVWNLACATTGRSRISLADSPAAALAEQAERADVALVVSTAPLAPGAEVPAGTLDVTGPNAEVLAARLVDSVRTAHGQPLRLRVELAHLNRYDGTVTDAMVQSAAIVLLDSLCYALEG
jgi:peptidoglycan hydrolase-like protein with peptidoglycan-binding domain